MYSVYPIINGCSQESVFTGSEQECKDFVADKRASNPNSDYIITPVVPFKEPKWCYDGVFVVAVYHDPVKEEAKIMNVFRSFQDAYDFYEPLPGYNPDTIKFVAVDSLYKSRPF